MFVCVTVCLQKRVPHVWLCTSVHMATDPGIYVSVPSMCVCDSGLGSTLLTSPITERHVPQWQ